VSGRPEAFISVDVETDGPYPGDYSLVALGACAVDAPDKTFYRELRPISARWDPAALAVSGLSREALLAEGSDPAEAMGAFARWVGETAGERRPVFVAFNATFDWMFVYWYLRKYHGASPFGIAGLDIKAYAMGVLGSSWRLTAKGRLLAARPELRPSRRHSHHALDDAIEQADLFARLRRLREAIPPAPAPRTPDTEAG
jgi:DNA polymerase III epsilon subunit-like protein